jgi:adenine phosphoribosyltransferase
MGRLVKNPDYWVGIDARGFIFASALSMVYGGGVVMCRKKGKLPPPVQSYGYTKEYGVDRLEIKEGSGNVVIVDDVLASGGTLQVVNNLVENAGYTVKDNLVLIDLKYVPTIVDFTLDVKSLVQYE